VQYSLNGTTWTDSENATITVGNDNYLTGVLEYIELPEEMNHKEEVFLRWLCNSTVSISGGTVASTGVNRLDVTIYGVSATVPFVPVTDIINVPATVAVEVPKLLTGTVIPENATNKTIVWSVKDAGSTGATINNNILNTTNTGTVKVTATITDGTAIGEHFIKDFSIEVVESVIMYVITATVNNSDYGTISPSGEVEVEEGGSMIFTITPFTNYKISDVLVNNISQGAITSYTFDDVQSDGTIHVIFGELSVCDNEFSNINVYSHQNSIFIKNVEKVLSAEIMDMNGRLIYQTNITDAETMITLNIPNGIYHIRLISQDGKSVSKKVFIMR
jgi:hypothetical protein